MPSEIERDGPRVLAVIEEPKTTRRCLTAAAKAAAVFPRARLTALHIEVDPKQIRAAPEEISVQQLRTAREGSAHDRAIQIQRIFELWTSTNPSVTPTWQKTIGTVNATLSKAAANADLIVICQPHNLDGADALHSAIFHSNKLVLFIPQRVTGNIKFGHLAIAWKETPQAVKAVAQALPWLSVADHVSVLIGEESSAARCSERLERLLGKNRIPFDVRQFTLARGSHIGLSLVDAAQQAQADALVMGAYRFGRIFNWIFGGATSKILQNSNLPLFLAH